jgi:hypothetical protein
MDTPWNRVKAYLLCGPGAAMRQCILLATRAGLKPARYMRAPTLAAALFSFTAPGHLLLPPLH